MTSNNAPTDEDAKIGGRIRKRRKALGMTLSELGARVGVGTTQIWKYELGTNRVPAARIFHFACILQVDLNYFFADYVSVEEVEGVVSFVGSHEGIELNRAFIRIADPSKRASIAALAAAISETASYATPVRCLAYGNRDGNKLIHGQFLQDGISGILDTVRGDLEG